MQSQKLLSVSPPKKYVQKVLQCFPNQSFSQPCFEDTKRPQRGLWDLGQGWAEHSYHLSPQPGKDSLWLPGLVVARVIFVPLLLLCNVQPRYYLPVFFEHDSWFILFMAAFAFSNGYLASLCMCFGPK